MERTSRTEITIETDRTFVIQRKRPTQTWCPDCAQRVPMVTPEEAVHSIGLGCRVTYLAEAGRVHCADSPEGFLLVCLKSLLLAMGRSLTGHASSGIGRNTHNLIPETTLQRAVPETQRASASHGAPGMADDRQGSSRLMKWGLTAEAFEKLLGCLDPNRERAGHKYEDIRRRLIKYFECRRCQFPEDQADETINRVARKISDGCEIWTSDPASYFYGVARYVLKEYWSSPDRDFLPLDSLPTVAHTAGQPPSIDSLQSERSMESRLQALDHCIQELSPEDRDALLQYYQGEKGDKVRNRKNLARQLAIPVNALRIKVHRIRKRLEAEVNEYMERQG